MGVQNRDDETSPVVASGVTSISKVEVPVIVMSQSVGDLSMVFDTAVVVVRAVAVNCGLWEFETQWAPCL